MSMTKLERLYQLASDRDIEVVNYSFSKNKKAFCCRYYIDGYECKNIIFDKPRIINAIEEVGLMAEELGHFETHSLYIMEETANTALARNNRAKYEAKARRWGIKYLITPKEIQRAIDDGCVMNYEFADHLGVSTDMIHKAMELYKQKGYEFNKNTY